MRRKRARCAESGRAGRVPAGVRRPSLARLAVVGDAAKHSQKRSFRGCSDVDRSLRRRVIHLVRRRAGPLCRGQRTVMYDYANEALSRPTNGLADLHLVLAHAVMGDDAGGRGSRIEPCLVEP